MSSTEIIEKTSWVDFCLVVEPKDNSKVYEDELDCPFPKYLTASQTANLIGIGRARFEEGVEQGILPKPIYVNGRQVWEWRRVEEALDADQESFEREEFEGCLPEPTPSGGWTLKRFGDEEYNKAHHGALGNSEAIRKLRETYPTADGYDLWKIVRSMGDGGKPASLGWQSQVAQQALSCRRG